jgi:4-amino-4-deoxy-L-arabinose transferase-like glycosyltransferase
VNDNKVATDITPFCELDVGRTVDLGPYLHAGRNDFTIFLKNDGGPGFLSVLVSKTDWRLLIPRLTLILSIIILALLILKRKKQKPIMTLLGVGFTTGIILRLLYVYNTLYTIRGHDPEGHVEYLTYVAKTLTLPPTKMGWEYYHPPLYYVLSGLWMRLGSLLGFPDAPIIRSLQWHAFLVSLLCLAFSVWMASLLFRSERERSPRALFVWVLAVFPSLVFFAPRINNDVFLALWEFLAFAFLLQWWQEGRTMNWILATMISGLAILTKSNALLFLPILLILLFLKKGLSLRKKMLVGGAGFFFLFTIIVLNFTLRSGAKEDNFLVPNLSNLNDALLVDSAPETLTEFNVLRLILHPFNNAWESVAGRDYFWEYFLKSAFFGEFDFGRLLAPFSSALLVVFLLLLPVAGWGLFSSLKRWYDTLPLWLTTLILLIGHAAYRQIAPYSSSQDFRYSILLVIPLAYFLALGWSHLSGRLRLVTSGLLLLFLVLCGGFLISVSTFV